MKFCSVGALKYKNERAACDSIQYLFDNNTPKPTDAQSFLDIISEARSIAVDLNGSDLTCSALAGYRNNKLYLASITVGGGRTLEVSNNAGGFTTGTAIANMFYQFGCVKSNQQKSGTISSGDYSFLDASIVSLSDPDKRSTVAFSTKTNGYGYKLVLYPKRVKTITNSATVMDFNTSAAQSTSSYSSSSYQKQYNPPYGGWYTATRSYQYTTALGQLLFDTTQKKVSSLGGYSYSSIGAGNVTVKFGEISNVPGIGLIRPSQLYNFNDSGTGSSSSYYIGSPEIIGTVTATPISKAPYVESNGTDETVELGFSVIAYRDLEKDNIVIRDFVTDLTQSGSNLPGDYPTVSLNTPLPFVQTILDM